MSAKPPKKLIAGWRNECDSYSGRSERLMIYCTLSLIAPGRISEIKIRPASLAVRV